MLVFPGCKINLGLKVVSKRSDGFHEIESILFPVPWYDALELIPSDICIFTYKGKAIHCHAEDNICYMAYQKMKQLYKIPAVKLYLLKNIPMGAGLGGGSSDAAYVLLVLNKLFSLGLNNNELTEIAAGLGSDCSFFVQKGPCLASGKGEKLMPVSLNLKGYYLAIVKPDISISTAEAYKMIIPCKRNISFADVIKQPIEKWKDLLINDFETPVFNKYPVIKEIKNQLYSKGAIYASMSGSGSAVYGLFEKKVTIKSVFPDYICWMGEL